MNRKLIRGMIWALTLVAAVPLRAAATESGQQAEQLEEDMTFRDLRSAHRFWFRYDLRYPGFGFRVARTLNPGQ